MQPEVSVIIPVYNSAAHIAQALDSVLSQDISAIEVICIDDGSTDDSLHILQQYSEKDKRVRVYTQKNQYAGVARNRGLQEASGEYIAFLDADDFFLPGALSALLKQARQYKLDMLKGSFEYLDSNTGQRYQTLESVNCSVSRWDRKRVLSFADRPKRLLNVFDVPWNGIYRRDFLNQNKIRFNSLICVNDHSFFIHCLLKAQRIMICDTVVACYRIGQSSSLVGKKAKHFDAQIDSYKIVRKLCDEIAPEYKTLVLRNELNGMFTWYQRVQNESDGSTSAAAQLSAFLQEYTEADVGADFLKAQPYWELYWTLRYGSPAQNGCRPSAPVRAWKCWQEHGWKYTVNRVTSRKGEK